MSTCTSCSLTSSHLLKSHPENHKFDSFNLWQISKARFKSIWLTESQTTEKVKRKEFSFQVRKHRLENSVARTWTRQTVSQCWLCYCYDNLKVCTFLTSVNFIHLYRYSYDLCKYSTQFWLNCASKNNVNYFDLLNHFFDQIDLNLF